VEDAATCYPQSADLMGVLSEARQKPIGTPLIPCTLKLGLGALFDYPNEEPGACAERSWTNLNFGVHLSIVPIKIP